MVNTRNALRYAARSAKVYFAEARLQSAFIKEARRRGAAAYKLVCAGRRGFPDVLVLYAGTATFVELKSLRGRRTEIQSYCQREMMEVGATVVTVIGHEAAMDLLDTIVESP